MSKRYEEEFKKQIVALFNNGKSLADINKEYGVAKSTIKVWIERYNSTASFNINDSHTQEEKDLIKFKKRCKELEITKSLVYYHIKHRKNVQKERLSEDEIILENKIIKIF